MYVVLLFDFGDVLVWLVGVMFELLVFCCGLLVYLYLLVGFVCCCVDFDEDVCVVEVLLVLIKDYDEYCYVVEVIVVVLVLVCEYVEVIV